MTIPAVGDYKLHNCQKVETPLGPAADSVGSTVFSFRSEREFSGYVTSFGQGAGRWEKQVYRGSDCTCAEAGGDGNAGC